MLSDAVHELAQPAAAAALAMESATLLLDRGAIGQAGGKLADATRHVGSLQASLRALNACASQDAEPCADVEALLREIWPDASIATLPPLAIPRDLLLAFLRCAARSLSADGKAADLEVQRRPAAIALHITGRGTPGPALRLWARALRRCGAAVRLGGRERNVRIALRLPLAAVRQPKIPEGSL
ncbi:MAG: hypothetical protein GC150_17330 [Rhizobiales bacterium]|nr:hypothetical protein [Hyphomicrobiales bacterium]